MTAERKGPKPPPASALDMGLLAVQHDHRLRALLFGDGISTSSGYVRGEEARLASAAELNRMQVERFELARKIAAELLERERSAALHPCVVLGHLLYTSSTAYDPNWQEEGGRCSRCGAFVPVEAL